MLLEFERKEVHFSFIIEALSSDVVEDSFDPSIREAKAGGSMWVQGQTQTEDQRLEVKELERWFQV